MRALIIILPVLVLAQPPDQPLAPWGLNHHPTDVPKRHVEQVTAGRHAYTVRQGGTMDGTNCRSPVGVGMMDGPAIRQTWESNRAVRARERGARRMSSTPGCQMAATGSAPSARSCPRLSSRR